jgi:hypothetical protein
LSAILVDRTNQSTGWQYGKSRTRRGQLLLANLDASPRVHRHSPGQIRQADAMYIQITVLTAGAGSPPGGRAAELTSFLVTPVHVGYAGAAHRTIMTRIKACQSGSRGTVTNALNTKRLVANTC